MKKLFCIIFIFFVCKYIYAQQDPIFTQYYVDGMIYNPAIAGSNSYNHFVFQSRQQWLNFDAGAPFSSQLSYHGAINNRSAMGGVLLFDQTLPSKQGYLQINYAYHVPLDYDKLNISFGLGAKLLYYNLDFSIEDLPPNWENDPAINTNSMTKYLGDASSGVYLYGRNFYVGYAVSNLLESSFNDAEGTSFTNNNEYKHYYGTAGYRFQVIDKDWQIEPSILIRKVGKLSPLYDITGRIIYLEDQWLALTVRTNNIFAVAVGFVLMDHMHCAYSYDYMSSSEMSPYNHGTHELSFSFHFPSILSQRHISFWDY